MATEDDLGTADGSGTPRAVELHAATHAAGGADQVSEQPLLSDVTLYVDSVTGVDTNDGSSGAPFATIERAWTERKKYGELRAVMRVNLIGVGPYLLPLMHNSVADPRTGGFVLSGDPVGITHLATTATGSIVNSVLSTAPGLGAANAHRDRWLEVTSGPLAGATFLIVASTDSTVTLANSYFAFMHTPLAIGSGDAIRIFSPRTQVYNHYIRGTVSVSGFSECHGSGDLTPCAHAMQYLIVMSPPVDTVLAVMKASVALVVCEVRASANMSQDAIVYCGYQARTVGESRSGLDYLKYGAGCTFSSTLTVQSNAQVFGTLSHTGTGSARIYLGGSAGPSGGFLWMSGGRLASTPYVYGASLLTMRGNFPGDGFYYDSFLVELGLRAFNGGQISVEIGQYVFAQTTLSCLRAFRDGLISVGASALISGGTTQAGAYGCDASQGGAIYWVNRAPVLTGGTPGQDLHTDFKTVPNATLNATAACVSDLETGSKIMRTAG